MGLVIKSVHIGNIKGTIVGYKHHMACGHL